MCANTTYENVPGTILRKISSSFGVGTFLKAWERDAVSAVESLKSMGDRESYPGQYAHNLVRNGIINGSELSAAIKEWLGRKMELAPETFEGWHAVFHTLQEIYGYALSEQRGTENNSTTLCDWMTENFDSMDRLSKMCLKGLTNDPITDHQFEEDDRIRTKIRFENMQGDFLCCLVRSRPHSRERLREYFKAVLREYLRKGILSNGVRGIDEILAAAYYHADTKEWDNEVNRFLIRFAKQLRRIKTIGRFDREATEKLSIKLTVLLYRLFHPIRGVLDAEKLTANHIRKWRRSQGLAENLYS